MYVRGSVHLPRIALLHHLLNLLLSPEELAGQQRGWGGELEETCSAAATSTPLRRHRGDGLHQRSESCLASLLRTGSGGAPVVQDTDNSNVRSERARETARLDIYARVKWGALLRQSSKSHSAVEKMPHRGLCCCRYRDPSPFASSSTPRACA